MKLHRCECGGIAEWHYIISRGADGKTPVLKLGLNAGTKCWAPGQPSIGVEQHVLNPDFSTTAVLPVVKP